MKRMRKLFHPLLMALTVFIYTFLGGSGVWAADSESIGISAKVGIDGYFKIDKWTQVKVTLVNKGQDFKGMIRISSSNPSREIYEKSVTLTTGQTSTIPFEVPGEFLSQDDLKVSVLQEDKVISETSINSTPFQGSLAATIGDKDLFSFFTQKLSPNRGMIAVRPMEAIDLVSSIGLESEDVIVINHPTAEYMQSDKKEIIKRWVEMGGTLIVGGDPQRYEELKEIHDLLPIKVSGQTRNVKLDAFTKSQTENISGEIPVSIPQSYEGKVRLGNGDTPLIIEKQLGLGKIIQTTFDLSARPLLSWNGYSQFWKTLLDSSSTRLNTMQNHGIYELTNASQFFPHLRQIPLGTMVVCFVIYLLIAGPGLYWYLRKKDKRVLGWILLPSLSLLLTMGILATGSGLRGNKPYNQAAGIVEIANPNFARIEAAHSFVTPSIGDFIVESSPEVTMHPFGSPTRNNEERVTITGNGDREIQYEKLNYMTMGSVLAIGSVQDAGATDGKLVIENQSLVGSLTNRTKFNLHDVRLVVGTKVILLPDMPVGKTIDIRAALGDSTLILGQDDSAPYVREILPIGMEANGKAQRYYNILSTASSHNILTKGKITLLGWTEDPLHAVSIKGHENNRGALYLVEQELPIAASVGEQITLPNELIYSQLVEQTGEVSPSGGKTVKVGKGTVTFAYQPASPYSMQVEKVQLHFDAPEFQHLQKKIFNWQTMQWDELKVEQTMDLTGDQLTNYLGKNNQIQIQVINSDTQNYEIPEPKMTMSGEVIS